MGAATWFGSSGSARSLAAAVGTTLRSGIVMTRGCPLSSKKTSRSPPLVDFTNGHQTDDQRLARVDLDSDLLVGGHAVEEDRRGENVDAPEIAAVPGIIDKD